MFTSFTPAPQGRRVTPLGVSLAIHGLLLAALLYRPGPSILTPSSRMKGEYGSSMTSLYWPNHPLTAASHSRRKASRKHFRLPQHHKLAPLAPPEPAMSAPVEEEQESQATSGPPAGTPFGTANSGSLYGDDIKPALPVSTSDPVVGPADLKGGIEGNEIVEITIDEKGNIVQKVVLQSLGPAIDAKVLAALESWHFRPATRNGVAISSKQDVYYHFPPQG
jgi:TonB family protein